MSSRIVDEVLKRLRAAAGTPLERPRDALVHATGAALDWEYRRGGEVGLHPLARLTTEQVGDPLLRWDVDDLAGFRAHFEELLTYLPHRVSSVIADTELGADASSVRLRAFKPPTVRTDVTIVYLHGGGFVLGSERSNDPECDYLATKLGCRVVSLGYPCAPEHPFPIPLTATIAALRELSQDGPLVLCGESAGGNLAVSSIMIDSDLLSRTVGLVLAYPMLDLTLSSETVDSYSSGYFLTKELLEWFVQAYAGATPLRDARLSPLYGDLSHLPPTLIVLAEFDPLRGDGERLANAAAARVQARVFPGMIHGFLQFRGITRYRRIALDEIVEFIRGCLPS